MVFEDMQAKNYPVPFIKINKMFYIKTRYSQERMSSTNKHMRLRLFHRATKTKPQSMKDSEE